jgi:hypothetical protein
VVESITCVQVHEDVPEQLADAPWLTYKAPRSSHDREARQDEGTISVNVAVTLLLVL